MALIHLIVQAFLCFEAFTKFYGELFTLIHKAIDIQCINRREDATGAGRKITDNNGCEISPSREMVK